MTPAGRFVANLAAGIGGTLAAVSAQEFSHIAAGFAGVATGLWMLTQTVIALRKNERDRDRRGK